MNVGFIGAGKVGCSFGKYFQEHKIQVTGFYSKSEDSSLAASNFTSSKQYLNLRELVDENDTIFITTPDGQIQINLPLQWCNIFRYLFKYTGLWCLWLFCPSYVFNIR